MGANLHSIASGLGVDDLYEQRIDIRGRILSQKPDARSLLTAEINRVGQLVQTAIDKLEFQQAKDRLIRNFAMISSQAYSDGNIQLAFGLASFFARTDFG